MNPVDTRLLDAAPFEFSTWKYDGGAGGNIDPNLTDVEDCEDDDDEDDGNDVTDEDEDAADAI